MVIIVIGAGGLGTRKRGASVIRREGARGAELRAGSKRQAAENGGGQWARVKVSGNKSCGRVRGWGGEG